MTPAAVVGDNFAIPRRPPDLTPSELGTPTDASAAQRTPSEPAPLPRPPSLPRPPRIPAGAARPGRRGETPSDNQLTGKIERLRGDATPAPLPPSPGARDAEVWFEQVPTNPALGQIAPTDSTAPHRKTQRSSRIALLGGGTSAQGVPERPWLLPALIAAIALTIGMILGALLFSKDAPACAPCDLPAQGVPKQ